MQITKFYSRSLLNLSFLRKPIAFQFSEFKQTPPIAESEYDLGSISIQPYIEITQNDILDGVAKLSYFSPSNIYNELDIASRELLFYLADDLGMGLGISIAAISFAIKLAFTPIMFKAQLNGIKMKLLEPETKHFQQNMQKLSQQKDMLASKQCQKSYKDLRKKHNISMLVPFLSLFQIPVLMTWFFSLKYVASLPDKYPGLTTGGFLWFKNLAEYDPYGLLPILSASLTYWNISLNPNMAVGQGHPLGRFYRYFKFFPFASIPIVVFFPAAINLYWCTSAFGQLLIAASVRSEKIRLFFGVPQYLPGTILERLNQNKQQTIIRAAIQESINDTKTTSVNLENQQQRKLSQETPREAKLKGAQTIKVYSHKPKKQV